MFSTLIWVNQASAACVVPATHYGIATSTTTVPTDGNYRLWVRLMAPDTTNNSVLLEIDGGTCVTLGDNTSIPANTWTWVNYQGGNIASTVNLNLTAGQHSLKFIGHERGVKVDRVILTADTSCVPSNIKAADGSVGGNCATPPDTTPPTVAITSPADNSTHSSTINLAMNVADDTGGSGVDRVELYVGARYIGNDSTSPYTLSVDPATLTAGTQTLTVRAYDRAGNTSSDTVPVNIAIAGVPLDTQAPTTPANITAIANSYNRVTLNWNASTDNVAVTGYYVQRGGVTIATVSGTTYTDSAVNASTTYSYRVVAFDATKNNSVASAIANATTPAVPDTTAPSTPTGLTANLVGSTQANLVWVASTDNIGVKEYDVYRSTSTTIAPIKIATVTTNSFGNTGLSASTTYSYYVIARDATGNSSPASATATITTPAPPPPPISTGSITGVVRNAQGSTLKGAKISIVINGVKRTIVTSTNGAYSIVNVAPGNYSLKYSATKYVSQAQNATVIAGQATIKNVTLLSR